MTTATKPHIVTLSQPHALGGVEVDRQAGIIRGVSVITPGPAIGHPFAVDDVMVGQVHEGLAAGGATGVKVRMTHPELTAGMMGGQLVDPIERLVGRIRNPRMEGSRLRADVHLGKYAASSPSGDLRTFLLDVAEEDPSAVGLSVAVVPDTYAHGDDNGNPVAFGRIKQLVAVDFVGDPGANPTGLLTQGDRSMGRKKVEGLQQGVLPTEPDVQAVPEVPDLVPETGENEETYTDRFVNDPAMQEKYPDGEARIGKAKGIWATAQGEPGPTEPEPEPEPEPVGAGVDAGGLSAADIQRQTLAADRTRREAIVSLATKHKMPPAWAQGLCDRGVSLAQATELVELATTMTPLAITVRDEPSRPGAMLGAMTDAICLRAGVTLEEPHPEAAKWKGLSVLDMYRQWLVQAGLPDAAMLSRSRLAELMGERAFRRAYPTVALAGAQSTADFTNILLDAANKTLLQAYNDAPRTWNIWARRATAPDFKNINRVSISEAPDVATRNEGGEYDVVTLSDGKETYVLVEYGHVIRLTRRAIINDDLDAFNRVPQLQGNACARKEDDVAYAILTANAAMADGVALFHADHANLIAAGGGAPTVATLAATEKLLMKQKGPKSAARLELRARFLLVPSSIYRVTQQLISSPVDPAKSNDAPNPFYSEGIVVVPSARLDDSSVTVWYLLADYSLIDTVEVCFLDGEETPVLKQETDFDTDDQKFAVRHTTAAKAVEYRGMAKNPGA